MLTFIRLLLDPLTWLGAIAGLVVGVGAILCVRWLWPVRLGLRATGVAITGALALGVAVAQVYEGYLLAEISAEMARSPPIEMLTATATEFEFRSVKYSSKNELLSALLSSSPRPERIGVSWFASGDAPAERQAAIANAELARVAVREAGLPVPRSAVGIESFGAAESRQPSPAR